MVALEAPPPAARCLRARATSCPQAAWLRLSETWFFRIDLPAGLDGKRRRRRVRRFATESEVRRALAQAKVDIDAGRLRHTVRQTVGDPANEWLEAVRPNRKASTFSNGGWLMRAYVGVRGSAQSAWTASCQPDVQKLYSELRSSGAQGWEAPVRNSGPQHPWGPAQRPQLDGRSSQFASHASRAYTRSSYICCSAGLPSRDSHDVDQVLRCFGHFPPFAQLLPFDVAHIRFGTSRDPRQPPKNQGAKPG